MKKRKSELKRAKERCWKALRLAVIRRDGGCQMPWYHIGCSDILQADHFVTRAKASTFFDIRNITCLCSSHNWFKAIDSSMNYYVGKIIEEREGEGVPEELTRLSKQPRTYTVEELDKMTAEFEEMFHERDDKTVCMCQAHPRRGKKNKSTPKTRCAGSKDWSNF